MSAGCEHSDSVLTVIILAVVPSGDGAQVGAEWGWGCRFQGRGGARGGPVSTEKQKTLILQKQPKKEHPNK